MLLNIEIKCLDKEVQPPAVNKAIWAAVDQHLHTPRFGEEFFSLAGLMFTGHVLSATQREDGTLVLGFKADRIEPLRQ
jgi:hypothetical protein